MASWPPLPCPACRRWRPLVGGACVDCWRRIDSAVVAGDGPWLVAVGPYRGELGHLLRASKYRPSAALLRSLGTRLGERVRTRWHVAAGWMVVPVPADDARRRRRGLDHAAQLAEAVAAALDPPRAARAVLRRRGSTTPQSRLPWPRREANVADAITVCAGAAVAGRRILLVDDVCTSGATLRACRRALLAAGTAEVRAAVVARAR